MDVSIIVIAADVREEVLRCLESIERHSGELAVETILVDNGSSDGTIEAVAARYPKVRRVRLPVNEGLAARNHGLRIAVGRYLMFLDSDAALTQGALEELVRFMDARPDAGLVGPRLVYPDGTLQLSTRRYPPLLLPFMRRPPLAALLGDSATVRRHLMASEPHERSREVEYVLGACQLFTAEAKAAAGEIDPRMFFGPDDAEWCFSIRRAGLRVLYDPDATVVHDYRRTSAKRFTSRTALSQLRHYYAFQWRWRRDRRWLIEAGRLMDQEAREAASAVSASAP